MLKKNKTTFFNHFTDRARSALDHANRLVDSNRNEAVEPAHFVLGVLLTDPGVGCCILKSIGIDIEDFQNKLQSEISKYPQIEKIKKIRPSKRCNDYLNQACEEALSLDHNYLGTEHLVLAMFRLREQFPADLIPASMTYDDARRAVMDSLGMDT